VFNERHAVDAGLAFIVVDARITCAVFLATFTTPIRGATVRER
jgi:hypothetical protein